MVYAPKVHNSEEEESEEEQLIDGDLTQIKDELKGIDKEVNS